LLSLGLLVRFVGTSAEWLDYPYPRPGSEGLILYESLLLKHGGDIYAPITAERFISGPYPPVFYWVAAAILPDKLPDFSTPGNVSSIFLSGRVVSLVSAFCAALLLPALIIFQGGYRRRGKRAMLGAGAAGLLAGILFLSLPQVMVWATRFRGDMLMIALTAAGLTCIAVGNANCGLRIADCGLPTTARPAIERSKGTPSSAMLGTTTNGIDSPQSAIRNPQSAITWFWLVAAAAFFSLAFYTKQTALAGPMAAAVYLLILDWRTGLKWCAAMGAFVLVPFAILDFATGNWFYLKLVTYHSLPLRALTLTRLLQFAFWEDEWPLVLLALVQAAGFWVVAVRNWKKATDTPGTQHLLVPLFTLAAIITLPTGAVVGADHNHLLMPGLAMAAGVGALLAQLLANLTGERRTKDDRRTTIGPTFRIPHSAFRIIWGCTAALLVAIYILFTSEPSSWYSPDLTMPTADQQEQLRKIVLNVSKNPGSLFFSDDPGLLALAGKETPYDDPFTMAALAPENRWDETAYRNHLAHGDFSLLLLSCDVNNPSTCRSDTFTPGVLDAIRAGYNVLFRDVVFTYTPRR
jgi:4-amino-4-deoxy-L-arabinose transferase-like glycosyltransferase